MAHLALYRTYRPQNFDAVVGQKHIVQTVKNQIKNDLLAHAYMFTGPRGTGKTSIARIVAKAINCTDPSEGNPCSTCESCLAINNGSHPDVLELDGASNNGVDEIRDIRDRVKYSPSLSPYKVYIIDEVHMLSTGAFNALLKTLEEPPSHVIFMLATTEIHKVPDTILSRTQRFDLKQIPSPDMTEHLTRILSELSIEFESGVVELITSLAAGGLRDALSMLDQAIAYKTDMIRLTDIHDLNGSAGADALVQLIDHINHANFVGVVESARALLAAGKLPMRIIDGLLVLLRDVLKQQKLGGTTTNDLAEKMTPEQVIFYIGKLNKLGHDLKIATDAELILEIGLIELGFKDEPVTTTAAMPTTTTSSNNSHYDNQISFLTEQILQLQNEIATLKSQPVQVPQPVVEQPVTQQPAIQPVPVPAPMEMPIYIQGERAIEVPEEVLDTPTAETFDQPVDPENLLIEDVLTTATTQDKNELQMKISALNAFANLENKEVVMLLKDAEIVAAASASCILVFDYETTAQKLLTPTNRKKAQQILAAALGREYGFIVMPKEFWLTQRTSYVEQKKQGVTPTLLQYSQQGEDVAKPPLEVPSQPAQPFYQDVADMFGDIVEINE